MNINLFYKCHDKHKHDNYRWLHSRFTNNCVSHLSDVAAQPSGQSGGFKRCSLRVHLTQEPEKKLDVYKTQEH